MPSASTMTGGRALLLCTNTEDCIYQSANGLHCCGLKLDQARSVVLQRPDLCGVGDSLSSLSNLNRSPGDNIMLAHKSPPNSRATENGLGGCSKSPKTPSGLKSTASIRDKISQWEGKTEITGANTQTTGPKETEVGKKKVQPEVQRKDSKRLFNWERQNGGKENGSKFGEPLHTAEGPLKEKEWILDKSPLGKTTETCQDKKSVLTHIKKLEQAMKETPSKSSLSMPGNYFCPASKEEQEEAEKRAAEPIFGTLDVVRSGSRRNRDPENVYSEPGAPSINPLPKPQRTFQHHTKTNNPADNHGFVKGKRNLPPLPSIPPPPLPSCPPPPGICRRPSGRARDTNNRKSYEFEDLLQSSAEGCRADLYDLSKLGLTRTLSEENVYEDILGYPTSVFSTA